MESIAIKFDESVSSVAQSRISYVFKTYCAVYGYNYTDDSSIASRTIQYGAKQSICLGSGLPSGYIERNLYSKPNPPVFLPVEHEISRNLAQDDFKYPFFHKVADGFHPDWMAEIFEWLSSACEYSANYRDAVGRVQFESTLHGLFNLDPKVPYAAIAMRGLNYRLKDVLGNLWIEKPLTPWDQKSDDMYIVATHDVDFYPTSAVSTLYRLFKNLVISILIYKDRKNAQAITFAVLKWFLNGENPLDNVQKLIEKESAYNITSSYYFICRRGHRRDANYSITSSKISKAIEFIKGSGFEVGVHGSYLSLSKKLYLKEEYEYLKEHGISAKGGRQHWLKYTTLGDLCAELVSAGAVYDCTVGYSDHIGFRSGACFPYSPYDFNKERAFPLIEYPLVIMDATLYVNDMSGKELFYEAKNILKKCQEFGWGGVSILWHDTIFGNGQIPKEYAELYWDLYRSSKNVKWVSGVNLFNKMEGRFKHFFENKGLY